MPKHTTGDPQPDSGNEIRERFVTIRFQNGPVKYLQNGTTTEHILEILMERMIGLQKVLPCEENRFAMRGIEMALHALNTRTKNRQAQKLEGTSKRHDSGPTLELADALITEAFDAMFTDGGKSIDQIKADMVIRANEGATK